MSWSSTLHAPAGGPVAWDAIDRDNAFIRAMRGVPQDPIHHAEGDVWIHTRMVAEAIASLPAYRAASPRAQAILFAAALLHDVGKPGSTVTGDDGRVTSKGHSTKGAALARRILWRAGAPARDREAVVALVRHHQVPFWLLERDDPRALAIRVSLTAACDLLGLVAEADARGRTCADQARILDNVALFAEHCREDGCLDRPFAFPSDHARFLWCAGQQRDPTFTPHESFRCEVTVMSGMPGAGKDTWIARSAAGLPVVSLDALREELDVDPSDDQGTIVQAARAAAREHLRAGRSFVWNATHLSRRVRGQTIRICADYGARVRIVHVEAPEDVLRAQNRARRRPVPEHVLDALLERWDVPDATEAHEVLHVTQDGPSSDAPPVHPRAHGANRM